MEQTLELLKQFRALELSSVIDFDKFNLIAITHHSTHLEGSTLTAIETQLLLDEEQTPKGKPLMHSLMVKDHYEAIKFTLEQARLKATVSPDLIKKINAMVLKNTGAEYHTALGDVDSSKDEFRLNNVRAGNRYFVNYAKVPELTEQFCQKIGQTMEQSVAVEQQLLLSFDAHFDLVSIHPFYDGNGRTARLVMNFLQAWFMLPLAIVFSEDKAEYIEALEQTREVENMNPFREFMLSQYRKYLKQEMERYLKSQNKPGKGSGFSFVF